MNSRARTTFTLILVTLLFTPPTYSVAQMQMPPKRDGNALLAQCDLAAKPGEAMYFEEAGWQLFCHGYLEGFVDGYTAAIAVKNPAKLICLPPNTTTGQVTKVVVKYLEDHAEKLHIDKAVLATAALAEAFPCE
jgi:hypothetical protein